MLKTVKALLIILFISTFSLQANSETSWITKKDKTKKTLVFVFLGFFWVGISAANPA